MTRRRRVLFAIMATGACFAALPGAARKHLWVDSLLFISGATQSVFVPVLGALALGLAGHKLLSRVDGYEPRMESRGEYCGCSCGHGAGIETRS